MAALAGPQSGSRAVILPTRRAWRPPSKGVASQVRMILSCISGPSISAERQSTFKSLWRRLISAVTSSWQVAARTPEILLAAIAMPTPVQHNRTPRSAVPSATRRATSAAMSG